MSTFSAFCSDGDKRMNVWDILILCAVVALVIFAVLLYRGRKKRGGCCESGSGCDNCASCSKCPDAAKNGRPESKDSDRK